MIYYPLSVLIMAGVREVLIISTSEDIRGLQQLLADGAKLGLRIDYATRSTIRANAFQVGRKFLCDENVALILTDQLFYGARFELAVLQAALRPDGATIFTKGLVARRPYDVVEFDPSGNPISIVSNLVSTRSSAAIAGFYLFDRHLPQIAADLHSRRGDRVTLSDISRAYLDRGGLQVVQLDTESAWFDIGTHEVQLSAAVFVEMMQNERGRNIGCVEEAAFLRGLITAEQLLELSAWGGNDYCRYLRRVALSAISRSRES
jgi:glucose-1-phosphate thymidylyltransferase